MEAKIEHQKVGIGPGRGAPQKPSDRQPAPGGRLQQSESSDGERDKTGSEAEAKEKGVRHRLSERETDSEKLDRREEDSKRKS